MTLPERLSAIRASSRRQARARGQRPADLTPAEVETIGRAARAGESMAALAKRYGVPVARVRRCAYNRFTLGWRNAPKGDGMPELVP